MKILWKCKKIWIGIVQNVIAYIVLLILGWNMICWRFSCVLMHLYVTLKPLVVERVTWSNVCLVIIRLPVYKPMVMWHPAFIVDQSFIIHNQNASDECHNQSFTESSERCRHASFALLFSDQWCIMGNYQCGLLWFGDGGDEVLSVTFFCAEFALTGEQLRFLHCIP